MSTGQGVNVKASLGTRTITFSNEWLVISAFRTFSAVFGIGILSLYRDGFEYLVPPGILSATIISYTIFKLIHPFRWYDSRESNYLLFGLDLGVALALMTLSGGIHGPFTLYALSPVLSGALLLSPKATVAVSATTVIYVLLLSFVLYPIGRVEPVEHISLLGVFITVVAVASILPYTINTLRKQHLKANATLMERRRIGRDIHDGIIQTVYGLRWEVQRLAAESDSPELAAGKLAPFRKALDEAEQSLRGSIDSLRSVQSDLPFLSQIQVYLSQIENSTGIQCRLEAENEPELDEFVKIQVLNIIAEALKNITKHSNASEVIVSSFTNNANLQIKVADNGIGFDPTPISGHGLTVMKERAESLGGWLKVISTNGMGTRILLEVPRKTPAGINEVMP